MDTTKQIIRRGELSDAASFALLSGQLGYPSLAREIEQRFALLKNNPEHVVFVAEVEGKKIAGWAHVCIRFQLESDPFAEITGLVVDEKHFRQGIGRSLINECKKWSKENGMKKIRVRANILRTESHQFYEHLGFSKAKVQVVFDEIL